MLVARINRRLGVRGHAGGLEFKEFVMTGSMMRHHALALAFGVALIGTSAAAAWADDTTSRDRSLTPSQEQTAQPPTSAESAARQQQLLNSPDPVINVPPSSELRNGAGETMNPQTGTSLPWTVQPD